jgi:regulator of sigma E protease
MSWVLTILGIVALVVLHELGHFTVAKAVGMRIERFSLFFPPKLLGARRGETEYMIGAIPLGGYVKITGMSWEELRRLDLRVAARGYALQAPWKRIAVILAGPGMNLLVAFALFGAVLLSGDLNGARTLELLRPSVQTVVPVNPVQAVERGLPASGVLRAGDRIVAVDSRPATPEAVRARIAAHRCAGPLVDGCTASTPVRLTVTRAGRQLALSIYPRYSRVQRRMLIGFDFDEAAKRFGAAGAAGTALREMWGVTTQTLTGFAKALTSERSRHEVTSIVGLTQTAHESVTRGVGYALVILAFISLALAVVNLFPFLPLDGGHVLWSVAEKLRGRRISLAAMYRFSSVGMLLMLFLVLNGVSNDINRLAG